MSEKQDRPPYLQIAGQNDDTVRVTWGRTPNPEKWDALDFWVLDLGQVISIGQLIEMISEN